MHHVLFIIVQWVPFISHKKILIFMRQHTIIFILLAQHKHLYFKKCFENCMRKKKLHNKVFHLSAQTTHTIDLLYENEDGKEGGWK